MNQPEILTSAKSIAHLHATLVIEELVRGGVELFCVSPGARSIPLLLAIEAHEKAEIKLFNDERSAAFFAQGYGRSGRLACLLSTSGTAVANYLPAVIEANLSNIPLVVLTAERPHELLHAKANQTIGQSRVLEEFCAETLDIPAVEQSLHAHSLLSNLGHLIHRTLSDRKPVHCNVAYRKPFTDESFVASALPSEELDLVSSWAGSERPYRRFAIASRKDDISPVLVKELSEKIARSERTLVITGPLRPDGEQDAILRLAEKLSAPVIADINSQLRGSRVCNLFNFYLDNPAELDVPDPDLVLYFGDRVVSDPLVSYLNRAGAEQILISAYDGRQDAVENEYLFPSLHVVAEPASVAHALEAQVEPKSEQSFKESFSELEKLAQANLPQLSFRDESSQLLAEPHAVTRACLGARNGDAVYLSPSTVFREADYCVDHANTDVKYVCNRGATGIDGVLSSALGYAAGSGRPTTVLIGDQALLHDLNALALVSQSDVPIRIYVVNNQGGGIFRIFDLEETKDLLVNAHSWHFPQLAEAFSIEHQRISTDEELEQHFQDASDGAKHLLCELEVEPSSGAKFLKEARSALRRDMNVQSSKVRVGES